MSLIPENCKRIHTPAKQLPGFEFWIRTAIYDDGSDTIYTQQETALSEEGPFEGSGTYSVVDRVILDTWKEKTVTEKRCRKAGQSILEQIQLIADGEADPFDEAIQISGIISDIVIRGN